MVSTARIGAGSGRELGSAGVHTSGGIQSLAASVALEVFRLLMGDEELQIFKVSFACNGSAGIAEGGGLETDSSNTRVGRGGPRHRGDRASSCPLC